MRFYQALGLLLLTNNHVTSFVPSNRLHGRQQVSNVPVDRITMSSSSINLSPKDILGDSLQNVVGGLEAGGDFVTNSLQKVVDGLDNINSEIGTTYQTTLQSILTEIKALLSEEKGIQGQITSFITQISQTVDSWLLQQNPEIEQVYKSLLNKISESAIIAENSTPITLGISAFLTYSIISTILSFGDEPRPSKPYPLQRYDPISAQAYFDGKIVEAATRAIDISLTSLTFGLSLLKDYANNQWEENQELRGKELAELLTKLGPTFIKIGQSLSIRTDILSPAYVRGLTSLQDNVPAFDTVTARQIMEEEWGQPVDQVLSQIGGTPVAAASLGQVYKGTLMDGTEVAIKVQRPKIMNQIALDMHLLREFAPIAKRTFNLNTDTVGTVDAWGAGFVDELDYMQEAQNGKYFMKAIQDTPLKDVVIAPDIVDDLTTPKVLVTEWIDGERLDKSSSEDITVLCSICMNAYLTMLLELGLLHCDPHPGNLLRTPEGKLCILDWGMVTRLPPELQLTLIEHMAHLTSSDYAEVPRDLLLLGFVPEDKANEIEDSGVVELLSDVYGQWTSGGGVAGINVNQVVAQLQDLTAKKGNLFQIPPYFAYIAKSFSVLEGIGLSNDAQYSIINECLPYVSNRLLTDKSQMGPALSTFVFGPDKGNVDTRIVDYDRVEQLVEGFGKFATSSSGALLGKEGLTRTQQLEQAADQVLDIVATDEETPFQDILLEQLAKITAASTRSIWTQARERSGVLPNGRTVLGSAIDPFGLFRSSSLVNTCETDEKTVETTRKLVGLMSTQLNTNDNGIDLSNLKSDELLELSTILSRKVWERRVALLKTGNRFATKLLQLTAYRLENGERVERKQTLPAAANSDDSDNEDVTTSPIVSPASVSGSSVPTQSHSGTSSRLSDARNRLSYLEELDELEAKAQMEESL